MALVDRMVKLYDKVYPISDRFGVKTHCDFTFLNRTTQLFTTVLPRPRAGSPPVNKLTVWRESGVEVNQDMLYVTGISRTFTDIKKGTICTIDNKPYTIMWLDIEQTVTFNILCRPERSR